MDVFASWIEAAFRDHYTRTADEPSTLEDAMQRDWESASSWEREGDPTANRHRGRCWARA